MCAAKKVSGYKPPRGINLAWLESRNRWRVGWRADGRQRFETFERRSDADARARELAQRMADNGRSGLSLPDAQSIRDLEAVRAALGEAPLSAMLACWARHKMAFCGGRLVAECAADYLRLTDEEKTHGTDSRRHVEKAVARFVEAFGTRPLPSVSAEEIRAWLASSCESHGLGGDARNGLLKQVRALFNRGVREGWCDANPAKAVATTAITRDEVCVLSVEDARTLFAANADRPITLRLALEAFGGIRHSGTSRLRRDDFRPDARGFLLPAKSAKGSAGKQRRHYAEGLPDNLWAWVARWWDVPAAWSMSAAATMHEKSAAFGRAGVRNPKNVLRHSFASYHVALHQDAAKTAILMQHTAQLVLWQHYKGVATRADAEAFFGIVPQAKS